MGILQADPRTLLILALAGPLLNPTPRLSGGGPVLLVDDILDSRWTFTVVAALLRLAGSGPVFPLALAANR